MPELEPPEVRRMITSFREDMAPLAGATSKLDQRMAQSINDSFRARDQKAFNDYMPEYAMGEDKVVDWIARADDMMLARFIGWSHARTQALRAQLNKDHDELVELSLDKVKKLINIEFFPADALRRVELAIEHYPVFDAIGSLKVAFDKAAGYFLDGIALSNLYTHTADFTGISTDLEWVVFHELLHASGNISGGGFIFNDDAPMHGRIWEEAFVSHASEVSFSSLDNPQASTYDPMERIGGGVRFSYPQERQVMGLISSLGKAAISPELWARAFFSDHDSKYQDNLSVQLKLAFSAIHPSPTAFQDFNSAYEKAHGGDEDVSARLLSALQDSIARYNGTLAGSIVEDEPASKEGMWIVRQQDQQAASRTA